MMPTTPSADESGIVSPDRVRLVLQGLLRAANQHWTDEALSAASGIKARAIKCYRVEGKMPSLATALSLAVVLGPNAVNSILALIGFVARPLDEADEVQPGAVVAGIARELATLALAAADGRIDHTERPGCQRAADTIIATVLPLASAGRAE